MEDKRQVLFPEVGCSRPRPRSSPPSWFSCPFGVLLNQQQFHWRHVEDIHLLFLFRVMRTKGHFLPQKKNTCIYIYIFAKNQTNINNKQKAWHLTHAKRYHHIPCNSLKSNKQDTCIDFGYQSVKKSNRTKFSGILFWTDTRKSRTRRINQLFLGFSKLLHLYIRA